MKSIEIDGGLCITPEDVDKLLLTFSNKAAKTKALQHQLNMHRTVLQYKPLEEFKHILKQLEGGKQLHNDQLADNLKTVIRLKGEQFHSHTGLFFTLLTIVDYLQHQLHFYLDVHCSYRYDTCPCWVGRTSTR